MRAELEEAIEAGQPITYRISRKGSRWYLTAMFSREVQATTSTENGVFGIDYNNGFMEVVETDKHGNMVSAKNVPLRHHGTGCKAETELKEAVSKIVRAAKQQGKTIIIEDLDFKKKKAKTTKKKNRAYNKMIHTFDYHRYTTWIENLCGKYGANYKKVNPAYTSAIGKAKYAKSRKLTIHRAAALVIARRGQGFKDKMPKKKTQTQRQKKKVA